MDLKVISGDDPATVDALFSLANIPGSRKLITGAELDALEGEEKEKAVLESNIFGRMRPDDKEQVVEILKKNGRYVAMIGDGVNDVRSLKAAQVGVALESGSNAARGVADMILVKDAFSALPKALIEGRKTISGMRDILKLYLTRNFALAVMFITIYLVLGNIPLVPIQNTFYAFISVSAIAFFMTLFAKPDNNKSLILPDVLRFAIPSAVYIALFGLAMYALTWVAISSGSLNPDFEWMASVAGFDDVEELLDHLSWSGSEVEEICARSSLVLFATLAGMGQILLVCPRYKFLSLDGRVNKSLVPLFVIGLLSLTLFAGYYWFPGLMVWLVNLVIFPLEYYAVLAVMLIIWFFSERFILKRGFFSKISDFFERRYERKLHEEYTKNYDEDDYRTKKI
jgi:cation-transporting ATPase E